VQLLPTVDFHGHKVTRLICGGNPLSGFSHVSGELDWEMIEYYTMPKVQDLLTECLANGINTFQSRGDRYQMRAVLEHKLAGGTIQWIAQTASEFASIPGNVAEIARYKPIAIYNHGTHTDNCWHTGRIGEVRDILMAIHDKGLPAGVGSHIPEVIEFVQDKGWEADFFMCCLYNLARGYKSAPATDQNAYALERYPAPDPPRMVQTIVKTSKPCIAFKLMAASRNCKTPQSTREAFRFALSSIKPTDMVDVGMFPKYTNQVAENAGYVREILTGATRTNR
jgi:hypothetical protein